MSIPNNANDGPHEPTDHMAETHPDRIMRYCLGKPPAASGTKETRYKSEEESIVSAAVPPFGRVEKWIMDDKRHETLWEFDIKRLKRAAETSDIKHFQPAIEEHNGMRSWNTSGKNFERLSKVADQILVALRLFSYEDAALLKEYDSRMVDLQREQSMFLSFERFSKHAPDIPGQSRYYDVEETTGEEEARSRKPTVRDLTVTERDQYCYIVDEVTSILAHVAWNSTGSSHWKMVILACLTKLSTKIKVLATRLPQVIARYTDTKSRSRSRRRGRSDSRRRSRSRKTPNFDASKLPIVTNYCKEYSQVSTWLIECIEHVLRNLGAQRPLYEHRNHLDLCTIVYEAGTRGVHTQIYQDRWASISGSMDRHVISWSLKCLDVASELLQTLPPPSQGLSIVQRRMPTTQSTTSNAISPNIFNGDYEKEKTMIQATANVNDNAHVKDIRSIMEFVIIMTPLSLASPLLGKGFAENLRAMSSRVEINWGIPQKIELHNAFLSMQRVGGQCTGNLPPGLSTDISPPEKKIETTSLARSWLADHRYRPLWRRSSLASSSLQQLKSDQLKAKQNPTQDDRERLKKITDDWVIQEASIVIKYPTYVNAVFGLTVVLVVGGILCGLLVGSRVDGVDPFNFAVFSWILAGFILLVAKIVRVADWTWRDFFLRQVTCRSVSEVANVTDLSQQEVLAYLLSSESHHILKTCGPFQHVFAQLPGYGLSIDVSPDIQTLLASGIIPVKVLTIDGEALVLLRLTSGNNRVEHIPVSGGMAEYERVERRLVCVAPPQSGEDSKDLVFNYKQVRWTKVLGIYNGVERRIR